MRMDDLLSVRSFPVNFHVLRDNGGLCLIDGGFIGGERMLREHLAARGWENEPIIGVIVTHGHLDHILNVARIAGGHGAWIAAPRLDAEHYAGHPQYSGWSRVAGILESIGRPLLGFQPFTPDQWIDDGNLLDVWHGLRAIHLPGHTAGHTGYFCEKLGLLFCGDLFASYPGISHFPLRIFNQDKASIIRSVGKVLDLPLRGVIPNHGDDAPPEVHLERLRMLAGR
jgi:glyoxylase-like metal-dependent hydrolase (beta-lactamase superfamily II)